MKKGMFFSVVFIAGFLFMLLPPLLKVSSARKQVVPIQDNYAIGVYFGLDLEHINIRPGSSWKRIMREMLEKDLVELGQRDSFWFTKTKELILSNPKKYLKNFLEKIYIFWNYYEFSPRESINYFRSESKFLSMPLFNFGSIMALSILGMLLGWNRFREKAMPIYIFVITYQVSLLPFMPLGRYRLPIAPFLTIFASYGVYEIYEVLRKREWGNLVKYISLVLPIFILTNTNPMIDYLGNFSRPHYHKALRHLEINNTSNALVELRKALLTHPNDADIYEAMGDVYIRMDDLQRAEASYKKALAIENEFPEAMEKLGIVYAKKGDLQEAKAVFEEILSSSPTEYPSTHINLGNCYRMEGDFRMAEKEYKRALTLAPNNLQALYRLATLYDEADNPQAATIWSRYRELIEKLK